MPNSSDNALLVPGQRAWVATGVAVIGFSMTCSFNPGGQRIFFQRNSAVPPFYSEGIHEDSSEPFVAWFFGPSTAFFFTALDAVPVRVKWL
jgi:hypothetical protein